jgi:hypothetical protein
MECKDSMGKRAADFGYWKGTLQEFGKGILGV